MESIGRLPPPHHLRRPLPGPVIGHRDPIPPHHGGYPPYDMPPHPEIMEHKLAGQHLEMQKLATENQRFAATQGTLREDLAAIQNEVHMLHNHVGAMKSEREQHIMELVDKLGKMEADLQGAEPLKIELYKARMDAQSLVTAREELGSRVQQLTEDNKRVHMDLQQVPALMSELETLRQEYEHCRATYEYEKKLYNEHLESLQVMEKNYMSMASEVEKLRAELKKHAENDRITAAGSYASYADGNTAVGAQSGPISVRAGYDAYRGPGPSGPGYDMQRGPGVPTYDPQRGPGAPPYDLQRGHIQPVYDTHRGPGGPGYDLYGGPGGTRYGYDVHKGISFESSTGPSGPQGGGHAMQQANNASFGSVAVTAHTGGGFHETQVQLPPPSAAADGNHPDRR